MTTTVHSTMTGADLHEPKGVASALLGQVYVSDGAGSGVWTAASSVIVNTAFSTGDLKPTHKTTADASWIMWVDGTIGDGSSSATLRANADTAALFALYWANANCLISGGKGISAVADFAAHKAISIPVGAGRSLANAGTGSGLATHALGSTATALETITLVKANLPAYTPAGTVTIPTQNFIFCSNSIAASAVNPASTPNPSTTTALGTGNLGLQALSGGNTTFAGTAQGGTSTPFSNLPPTSYVNVMIKL